MTLIDPAAARAFSSPNKVMLFEWRCPQCRERLAVLWSTPEGDVFHANLPHHNVARDEHRALREAGVPNHHEGVDVMIQMTNMLTPTNELVVSCGKHGAQAIRATTAHLVYAVVQ